MELHAHLHGSIRLSTLMEMAAKSGTSDENISFLSDLSRKSRDLDR